MIASQHHYCACISLFPFMTVLPFFQLSSLSFPKMTLIKVKIYSDLNWEISNIKIIIRQNLETCEHPRNEMCNIHTLHRTKATLSIGIWCFTGSADPWCKIVNIFCPIAFLVDSNLASIKERKGKMKDYKKGCRYLVHIKLHFNYLGLELPVVHINLKVRICWAWTIRNPYS